MEESKKWYASKGIWGSLIAGGTGAAMLVQGVIAYLDANPDAPKTIITALQAVAHNGEAVLTVVAAFFAWYGRWKADKTISNKPL